MNTAELLHYSREDITRGYLDPCNVTDCVEQSP
jgi:hypothetical protein